MAQPRAINLLWPFVRRYGGRPAGAAAALLVAAGLVLLLGQGLRQLIDGGFASGSVPRLNAMALSMAGVIVALALATAARFSLVN